MYSSYGIAIDGANLWDYGNEFAKNVDISLSFHTNNYNNNFILMILMVVLALQNKSLVLTVLKKGQWVSIILVLMVIYSLMEKNL